jgi:hypothetical protein
MHADVRTAKRNTLVFLLAGSTEDTAARTLAFMQALHVHAGRAWVMLDRPLAGMPPRILGM